MRYIERLFSFLKLKELSMIAWQNERDEQGKLMTRQIPGIQAAKVFSKNVSLYYVHCLSDCFLIYTAV